MAAPQQAAPLYTEEELKAINEIHKQEGLGLIDEFGQTIAPTTPAIPPAPPEPVVEDIVEPVPTPKRSFTLPAGEGAELISPTVGELQQFGTVKSIEEMAAQRDFEAAFDDLFRANLRQFTTEDAAKVPELRDLTPESPDYTERVSDYVRQKTMERVRDELGFVPGFPLEGYGAGEREPMQFPQRMLGGILPAPAPARPADLPEMEGLSGVSGVVEALRPQSRVGGPVAQREQRLSRLKSAEEMISEQNLDPEFHLKVAERQRLFELSDIQDLTPEQQTQLDDLTKETAGKDQFGDINQIAQIRGFVDAFEKFNATTLPKSDKEAADTVLKEIQDLGPLLAGSGPPSRYKEHVPGTQYDSALVSALAPQIRQGRVPILSRIQEDYLKAYRPVIEQAYVDVLPYQLQEEQALAAEAEEAPDEEGGLFAAEPPPSPLATKPAPITLEDAKANYDDRLRAVLDKDFYAIDYWENPDKYAQGWSWWNQSYPSGAFVEGPGSVLLRWAFTPANVVSRAVYDTAMAIDQATGGSIPEPTEVQKIAGGMDPKYAGHPYLRNIAENRSLMDDFYDLYWYNGNKDLAYLAGGVGLLTDMFIVPFDPGISQTYKGLSAAVKSKKIANAVGMPARAGDVAKDAAKAIATAYGDSSPLVGKLLDAADLRLLDPAEYGATRAADFMKGANAYRAAYDDAIDIISTGQQTYPAGTTRPRKVTYVGPDGVQRTGYVQQDIGGQAIGLDEAHEMALNAATEALAPGSRGNPFIDFARKKGREWSSDTVQNLASKSNTSNKAYNTFIDDLYRYMKGTSEKLPKGAKRLVDAFEANHGVMPGKTIGERLRSIYQKHGVSGFAHLTDPLNYKVAQSAIVNVLDQSRLTRNTWRGLRQVTENMFMTPEKIKAFTQIVVNNDVMKTFIQVQGNSPVKNGAFKAVDTRPTVSGAVAFRPKVGTYYTLSDGAADDIIDIATDLEQSGFLGSEESKSIVLPLRSSKPGMLSAGPLGADRIISTDNMRRLISAQLEKIAFDSKVGVGVEAFEGASTRTKRMLLEPVESRHLVASWPKRFFGKLFDEVGSKAQWSTRYQRGTPLVVVRVLDKLRGSLANMNVNLRRDITELMNNPQMQAQYFDLQWLGQNEVTRNDAIIALALGPRAGRARTADVAQSNLTNLLLNKHQDVVLDVMSAFKRASVQRSNIADALTLEGKQKLLAIMQSHALMAVNGYEDWSRVLGGIYDDMKTFMNDATNFSDPGAKFQLAAPDASTTTAGFYYMQQQKRLVNDAINGIAMTWPGAKSVGGFVSYIDTTLTDRLRELGDETAAKAIASYNEKRARKTLTFPAAGLSPESIEIDGILGRAVSRRMQQIISDSSSPSLRRDLKTSVARRELSQASAEALTRRKILDIVEIFDPPGGALSDVDRARRQEIEAGDYESVLADPKYAELAQLYDQISAIAETIIRTNGLNSSSINQNLSMFDDIFKMYDKAKTAIAGEKGVVRDYTQEIIARNLEGASNSDITDLLDTYMMGIKVTDQINTTVNNVSQVRQIREAIDGLFQQDATRAYKVVKGLDALLSWVTRARYQTILAGRLPFHAVNVTTAPFLVWGTIGGRAAVESTTNLPVALGIMNSGRGAIPALGRQFGYDMPFMNSVAVTDPFGRKYTVRDVYDMAFAEGALRSQTKIILSPTQYAEMLDDARFTPEYSNFVKRGMSKILDLGGVQAAVGAVAGLPSPTIAAGTAFQSVMAVPSARRVGGQVSAKANRTAQFLADMTEAEDNMFRLATVIGALKRGADPAEALRTGARALLDYGDLSDPEKWLMTRFAMFYSFWRLNLGNTVGLLFSNPKRLVNIYRAATYGQNQLSALGANDNMQFKTHELNFYKHHFLLGRPILNYVEGVDRNTYYEVAPGIPILDAMGTIAQLMFAPTPEGPTALLRGFADPTTRAITGQEQTMEWRRNYIDPKDMYVLDKTWWGPVFWDAIIGEQPKGNPAISGEEAWQGQKWTLTPAAFERYLTFKNTIGPLLTVPNVYTGATLPFTLMVSGGDPELEGRRFPGGRPDPLSVTGLVRDVGGIPMTDQRRRVLELQLKRLQALQKFTEGPKKR